jgi:hypothetical protein
MGIGSGYVVAITPNRLSGGAGDNPMRSKRAKPQPCGDYKGVQYGLLSPNGKLYPCGWHEHNALAFRVTDMSCPDACARGWMMLTVISSAGKDEPLWYWGFEDFAHAFKTITGEQINTIWDWCRANGHKFPGELIEEWQSSACP